MKKLRIHQIICLLAILSFGVFSNLNAQNRNKKDSIKVSANKQSSDTTKPKISNPTSKSSAGGNSNSIPNDCQQNYNDALVSFNKRQYDNVEIKLRSCIAALSKLPKAEREKEMTNIFQNYKLIIESLKNIDKEMEANQKLDDLYNLVGYKFGNNKANVEKELDVTVLD